MSTRACGRLAAYVAELRGVVGVGADDLRLSVYLIKGRGVSVITGKSIGADDLRLFVYLIEGRGAGVVKGKRIGAEDLRRGGGPTGRGIRR